MRLPSDELANKELLELDYDDFADYQFLHHYYNNPYEVDGSGHRTVILAIDKERFLNHICQEFKKAVERNLVNVKHF